MIESRADCVTRQWILQNFHYLREISQIMTNLFIRLASCTFLTSLENIFITRAKSRYIKPAYLRLVWKKHFSNCLFYSKFWDVFLSSDLLYTHKLQLASITIVQNDQKIAIFRSFLPYFWNFAKNLICNQKGFLHEVFFDKNSVPEW